jgi:hypothetical protein
MVATTVRPDATTALTARITNAAARASRPVHARACTQAQCCSAASLTQGAECLVCGTPMTALGSGHACSETGAKEATAAWRQQAGRDESVPLHLMWARP